MSGGLRDRIGVWLRRSALARRLSRYTMGSAVAFATSEVTLVACFATGLLGAAAASVAAFVAGAIPNYLLNRYWVWRRDAPTPVHRELGPYVVVSALSLAAGAGATTAAAAVAPPGRSAASAFVAVAYLASYGVLFFAKFAAFHRFVFSAPDREVRRAQVGLSQPRDDGLAP